MAATPILALPYPVGTDRVMDGDNAMQALAERVEAALPYGKPTGGYAQVVANQAVANGSMTDLTGLAVAVTTVAGRRYRITGRCWYAANAANGAAQLLIREGAVSLNAAQFVVPAAAGFQISAHVEAVIAPAAGAHTYKLSAQGIGSAGTMATDVTFPAFILIEDMGPAA